MSISVNCVAVAPSHERSESFALIVDRVPLVGEHVCRDGRAYVVMSVGHGQPTLLVVRYLWESVGSLTLHARGGLAAIVAQQPEFPDERDWPFDLDVVAIVVNELMRHLENNRGAPVSQFSGDSAFRALGEEIFSMATEYDGSPEVGTALLRATCDALQAIMPANGGWVGSACNHGWDGIGHWQA